MTELFLSLLLKLPMQEKMIQCLIYIFPEFIFMNSSSLLEAQVVSVMKPHRSYQY